MAFGILFYYLCFCEDVISFARKVLMFNLKGKKIMDTRKIVLSLTAMIGFCSLSVQAQTNNTGRVQDTVKQSIDTLINKVGSDVKQAAKTTVDKVGTDVNTVKSGAQRAGSIGEATADAGVEKVEKGFDKAKQTVQNAYGKGKAKVKTWETARRVKRVSKK